MTSIKCCRSINVHTLFVGIGTLLCVLVMHGCGTATMKIASIGMPSSKYTPTLTTSGEVDDYFRTMQAVSGEIVHDKMGSYYHKINGDHATIFFLNADDETALRNAFANGSGLLEPVYNFNSQGDLAPDWSATQRRYDMLKQKARLNLLPVSASKAYHSAIQEFAKSSYGRMVKGGIVSTAFSGNMGLYNKEYYANVLKKIGANFEYVISDPVTVQFYNDETQRAYGRQGEEKNSAQYYRSRRLVIEMTRSLNFAPVEYYKNLISGGDFRYYSSCALFDPDIFKEFLGDQVQANAIPYVSGIAFAINDRKPDAITAERKLLDKVRGEQDAIRTRVDQACVDAFLAMQVTGNLQSNKLK